MALIHILDKQSDKIIGTLNLGEYSDSGSNEGKVSSSENKNKFDFTALKKFDLLQKRNRLLLQDRDGFFSEYIIIYAEQNSRNQKFIKSNATFTDLQKAKIIEPQVLQGATSDTATTKALEGTEWRKGKVDYNGIRTLKIEEYTNPYNLLKIIASEFGLDLRFRVAVEGNKIARYVDLTLPDDEFDGKEVVFGKDLIGLRRIEDAQNIVTALLVLGPEREDGTRLTVFVEDNDALQRWGRNGQHLIEVYEPQISAEEVTTERLRTLGQNALQKRIDALVTYECQAAILEDIPGKEHEKISLDRTLRIKDEGYTPPLYVEAKVIEVKEQPSTGKILDFKLGNYKEFSKADLEAQVAALKKLLSQKASNAKLVETYELALQQAEEKAAQAEENAKGYTDTVKVEVVEHANTVANQAENNAKSHADMVAGEAESNAKAYALSEADKARIAAIQAAATDAQTKVNAAKTALEADIATKVDAEWVNGQLVLKENAITKSSTAPANPTTGQLWLDTSTTPNVLKRWTGSAWVKATPTSAGEVGAYTKTEVDNALNSKVSVTQYTTDMNGVVTRLNSAESRITQTEQEIATKVSNTQYQQDKTTINNNISQLQTKMSNAETSITQLSNQITLKANASDVYTKTEVNNQLANKADNTTVNVLETRISEAEAQLTVQADQIATKVSQTTFTQELSKKENAVTKSNSAPSNPSTNQLWLDTSVTPNVLKRWNGSAWVKSTPTTAGEVGAYTRSETDSRLATKANQSDLNTLTTRVSTTETSISQLSNQIALKANATDVYTKSQIDGQMTTINQQISQLDAELTVQADQIATKVSKTEFESLQIGGRNLLLNSGLANGLTNWRNWGTATGATREIVDVTDLSAIKKAFHFISPNGNGQWGYAQDNIKVLPNTTYTASFLFKSTNGTKIYIQKGNGTTEAWTGVSAPSNWSDGNWHRLSYTWTTSSTTTSLNFYCGFDNGGTGEVWIAGMKLELGNRATDWTPAPEDVQGQIDGLGSRVTTAETSIVQLSNQIQLKANQSTVDTLANRISSAESTLTIHTNQIASKVSQTTFESALSGKENTVYKQNTAPAHANGRFWLDTSKTPNVLYRSNGSAWIKVTPTLAGEVGAFSQADGNTLAGRLSTAESTITQQADLISQKVSKTDYNGNTIASLINQTAEEVSISAQKINFDGHVFGTNATFKGKVEGAQIVGSNILSEDNYGRVSITNGFLSVESKRNQTFVGINGSDEMYGSNVRVALYDSNDAPIWYTQMIYDRIRFFSNGNIGEIYATNEGLYLNGRKISDPDGVVAYGSNANGYYARFANGIQICWHTKNTTNLVDTPYGSLYYSGSDIWTFPVQFIDVPAFFANVKSEVGISWAGLGADAVNVNSASFSVFSPVRAYANAFVSLLAIGKWK